MARFESEFYNGIVALGDLQTDPEIDGSKFTDSQIIEPFAGLTWLEIDLYAKAVASVKPIFRLYRFSAPFGVWLGSGEDITLAAPITDTTTGLYYAFRAINIGSQKSAIVLRDAEIGATLRCAWRRVAGESR